ncbi:MAG: MBOAT family O-acyltransferase [Lachnospiraceae bacterium]
MDFISAAYLAFLCILLILYYRIPKNRQWILLLVFGIIFYSCFSLKMWVFLLFTAVTTYLYGRFAAKSGKWLFAVILLNIAVLVGLKISASGLGIVQSIGLDRFAVLVPVGISFYTLQTVAYMVDVHQGKIEAQNNFFKYLLFVTFFPQILQGPIPRYEELGCRLYEGHGFDAENVKNGAYLILWGFFQKMVIADRCNIVVNQIFANYKNYDGLYFWIAGILYSLQLYTDFAGCVSIAAGSARTLGIELPQNFNHPYFATSMKDFWRRWHISLSRFLRDYIYIPLGGNRKGKIRKWINLMITFTVSGIWHGIGNHYLVWGMLHGFYQVMGEILFPVRKKMMKLFGMENGCFAHRLFSRLFTCFLAMVAWIFFRAENTSKAVYIVAHLFTKWNPWILVSGQLYALGIKEEEWLLLIFCILLLIVIAILHEKGISIRQTFEKQPLIFRWLVLFTAIFVILIAGIYGPGYDSAQFIYGGF